MNNKYYDIIFLTIFPILYFSYIKNTLKINIEQEHIKTFAILNLMIFLTIIIQDSYMKIKKNKKKIKKIKNKLIKKGRLMNRPQKVRPKN